LQKARIVKRPLLGTALFLFLLLPFFNLYGLTLSEAVERALTVSLLLKQQRKTVESSRFSYLSTLDPYLPKLTMGMNYERDLASLRSGYGRIGVTSRNLFDLSFTLSLRLFDGGERYALRRQALLSSEKEVESLRSLEDEVVYTAKVTFFDTFTKGMVVRARQEAYDAARRIHELTRERYKEGVAKRVEVLQSQVRMSEAEIDLTSAWQEYEKAKEGLKSILQLEEVGELEGPEDEPVLSYKKEDLIGRALSLRPDVKRQKKEVDRLRFAYRERQARFYPKLDMGLSEGRQGSKFIPEETSKVALLGLSFPIFDGLSRYYELKRLTTEIERASLALDELIRNVALEVTKAFLDFELAKENVRRAKDLLREAQANFEQAFEEYRVGKGDILTLLQSQKALAEAKERLLGATLSAHLSLCLLEKVACIRGRE